MKNMHMIPVTFAIILVLALVLAVAGQMNLIVNAQSDDAVVVIQPSIGGTTEPATGTHTYPSGTVITLRAIPDEGYTFQYWMVSGNVTPGHAQRSNQPPSIVDPETGEVEPPYFSQTPTVTPIDSLVFTTNPVNINCGYGYTYNYQAIFAPEDGTTPTPQENEAVVVIQPSIGGTTEPATGTHTYPSGTVITLRAIPDEGYTFQYWMVSGNVTPGHTGGQSSQIIDPETGQQILIPPRPQVSGVDSLVFTTNPVNINCGYGYTYNYQAVFAQTSGTPSTSSPTSGFTPSGTMVISPSPTIPELPTIAGLAVIIALTVACIIAIKIRKL